MSRALLGWGAIAACLGLTLWASSDAAFPLSRALPYVPGRDVTGHFLIMGALAAACVIAFARGSRATGLWRGKGGSAARVLAFVAVGVTVDELAQALIPSRTFSWLDLAASLAGVVLFGGLAAWWVARQRPRTDDASGGDMLAPEASGSNRAGV